MKDTPTGNKFFNSLLGGPIQEITGDIWSFLGKATICITTNGLVNRKGEAVLGRGCALQAKERFPDLPARLGGLLAAEGNHVHILGDGLVSFPVEESPWSNPDLRLIRRSAEELKALADLQGWKRIIVPRPGCGGGGLAWPDVKRLLVDLFDDRFTVISAEKGDRSSGGQKVEEGSLGDRS